jgi:hypothetical protein
MYIERRGWHVKIFYTEVMKTTHRKKHRLPRKTHTAHPVAKYHNIK